MIIEPLSNPSQNVSNFFTRCAQISDCPYLEVILKNDVLASKGSLQGIYALQQIINGKTSWKSASKAIWYYPDWKDWLIGDLKDIGNKTYEIRSYGDYTDKSPSDVANGEWNRSDDIIVQCKNAKGKISSHNFTIIYILYLQL